jgi:phosphatidylglycerophosphate synthase
MSLVPASFRDRVRAGVELPVALVFGRLGLTPNALTLIGFGIAVIAAYAAAQQAWLLAGLIVAFGALFDLFDGALARATGKTSRFGAFLDSTFDRAGEAVVYIGIAVGLGGGLVNTAIAVAALAASFMVSYTRARSESLGFAPGKGMAAVGLAPREVRMAILVIGLIGAGLVGRQGGGVAIDWLMLVGSLGLITVLATITTIQRIYFVYQQSKSQKENH